VALQNLDNQIWISISIKLKLYNTCILCIFILQLWVLGSHQERCTREWCPQSMVLAKAVSNQMVPPCVEWWVEMDNQATTAFGYCMAFLPVWPYCTNARWKRCQEDLNSFPLGELEETIRMPSYYMYYPAGPEWSNQRGSESSSVDTDVYVRRCTWYKWMNDLFWLMIKLYSHYYCL